MSENAVENTPNDDATPDQTVENATPEGSDTAPRSIDEFPEDAQRMIRELREEAKANRLKLKEAEPLIDAARKAEEANKSELERATERANKLEAELSQLRNESLRTKIATELGRPELAEFLSGDDEESLRAYGERLVGLVKPATPTPDLGQGARNSRQESVSDWLRTAARNAS